MSKKIIGLLLCVAILVTCSACKKIEAYPIRDYLSLLSEKAGLSSDDEHYLDGLLNFAVLKEEDLLLIDNDLDHEFLSLTLLRLLGEDEEDPLKTLKDKGWIKKNKKDKDLVDKENAEEIMDKAIYEINNRRFDNKYDVSYLEDISVLEEYQRLNDDMMISEGDHQKGDLIYLEADASYKRIIDRDGDLYEIEDVIFEDIFKSMELEGSFDLDIEKAVVTPGGSIESEETVYANMDKKLLSSSGSSNSFTSDGFKVTYSFKGGGIDAHISKNINGVNAFFDLSVNNIHPSYKWDYKDGKVNEAYFKIDYNATTQLGVSIGRYHNYYLDLKDLDPSSFMNAVKSLIKEKDDEVVASIKICEIRTPIPQVPAAFLNMEVLAKIYTTGKAELVIYSSNTHGFEIRNGFLRYIGDSQKDIDFSIGGSARSALGLNFNLEASSYRLMDIEADLGIRAALSTTAHLYDEEGEMESLEVALPYSAIDEMAKENNDVKVCADLSLNWVLELYLNTSKSLLNKLGFSKQKTVLDKGDQVFGNKTHIENGVFVDKCTRKTQLRLKGKSSEALNADKIILERYSAVINVNDEYAIPIKALPKGYGKGDLVYNSSKPDVAKVDGGTVKGISQGASEISISTSDGKYYAALNILVSSG